MEFIIKRELANEIKANISSNYNPLTTVKRIAFLNENDIIIWKRAALLKES